MPSKNLSAQFEEQKDITSAIKEFVSANSQSGDCFKLNLKVENRDGSLILNFDAKITKIQPTFANMYGGLVVNEDWQLIFNDKRLFIPNPHLWFDLDLVKARLKQVHDSRNRYRWVSPIDRANINNLFYLYKLPYRIINTYFDEPSGGRYECLAKLW